MGLEKFMRYSDVVLYYFFHVQQAGQFAVDEKNVITAKLGNVAIGIIQLQVKLNSANVIVDTRFLAHGCPVTIACAAWLAEYIQQKNITEIQQLTSAKIVDELHLTKEKVHCALLAEDVLQALLKEMK